VKNNEDEAVQAAGVIELEPGNEGVILLPATNRTHVALQVAFRAVAPILAKQGFDAIRSDVISNMQGKPLVYMIDTRDWPEEAEERLMTFLNGVKAGKVPVELRGIDLPFLERRTE